MTPDAQHLDELRRRIQEDPASLLFADLAEECRRQGFADEAVTVARAGLAHHPSHLDARITLGRALIDLERLDAAFVELTHVLGEAPGNVPAIRALAEIDQRRALEDAAGATGEPAAGQSIAELFDFDTLLAQLGETASPSRHVPVTPPETIPIQAIDVADDEDDFAVMERHLREFEEQRARDERLAADVVVERRRLLALQNLEHWLAAIVTDRNRPIS
ncbi:MAG TPA: tetratricopeptide repeat protein [Vicinamibacterales bacterium]|nr:tetratricopeptide repeat protein [Vicinamibacterales bacterium]